MGEAGDLHVRLQQGLFQDPTNGPVVIDDPDVLSFRHIPLSIKKRMWRTAPPALPPPSTSKAGKGLKRIDKSLAGVRRDAVLIVIAIRGLIFPIFLRLRTEGDGIRNTAEAVGLILGIELGILRVVARVLRACTADK